MESHINAEIIKVLMIRFQGNVYAVAGFSNFLFT